jgi:hypothetical protein
LAAADVESTRGVGRGGRHHERVVVEIVIPEFRLQLVGSDRLRLLRPDRPGFRR